LEKPFGRPFDGIYAVDVLEHIRPEDEDLFLKNITASLNEHGVCIMGTPSLESQTYASPGSKAGHINCKSGEALKSFMSHCFNNVFLFGMNDETLHTGFSKMAHYLFAVACSKRG
jgi:cyclopropane fatty-acyl-phospholipid synthase-like methyltransferase